MFKVKFCLFVYFAVLATPFDSLLAQDQKSCSAVLGKIGSAKSWNIGESLESDAQAILNDESLSYGERVNKYFDLMVQTRLSNVNDKTQARLREIISDIRKDATGTYSLVMGANKSLQGAGPHYNPMTNGISFNLAFNNDPGALHDAIIRFHELTHAFDHNEYKPIFDALVLLKVFQVFSAMPKVVSPTERYVLETRAIGSQWEMVSRIPAKMRQEIYEQLKIHVLSSHESEIEEIYQVLLSENQDVLSKLSGSKKEMFYRSLQLRARNKFLREMLISGQEKLVGFKKVKGNQENFKIGLALITLKTLENAELPKDEFIKEMRKTHGYTYGNIFAGSNLTITRMFWTSLGAVSLLSWFALPDDESKIEQSKKQSVVPLDVFLYIKLMGEFMAHEQNGKDVSSH